MISLLRFLTFLLCLAGTTSAAEASAKIRLLAFSRVGDEMAVNVLDSEGKTITKTPLALPTQQLSPVQSVAAGPLVFTAPADAKNILGKVTLPAAGGEFILIFLPAPKDSPQPYQVNAVALPESNFKSGDYAFVNYSGSTVGCVIAGKRLVVPQGKSTVCPAASSGKSAGNRTLVCYRQQPDQAWETTPFLSSRLIIQQGVRNLILICLDPKTGQPDFRGIPDFVEPQVTEIP